MNNVAQRPTPADRKPVAGIKEWSLLSITAAGLLIVYFSPLGEHLTHLQEINDSIRSLGGWGPLVFVLAGAVLTAIGFPRLLLAPLAGVAFGFGWGLAWGLIGALLGAYLTFCFARWAGRDYIVSRWPRLGRIADRFRSRGLIAVFLFRQLPNPGVLTNLFFGITPVSHAAFLIGTLAGFLPSAIPATLVGSSTVQATPHEKALYISAALGCLIVIWVGFTLLVRYSAKLKSLRSDIGTTDLGANGDPS